MGLMKRITGVYAPRTRLGIKMPPEHDRSDDGVNKGPVRFVGVPGMPLIL